MNCTHPVYAINRGICPDTGKMNIKLAPCRADLSTFQALERRYGQGSVIPLPCGKCLACKQNKAREWSIRCMLEASLYDFNFFLTLTYDDEHVPSDMATNKRNLSSFMKRLRNYVPGVRFFGCGERGSSTKRLHLHLILFNCKLDDLKPVCAGRTLGSYMSSKTISDCWQYGNIVLGFVTPESCSYVARYTLKECNGDEFILMSNKPGIGAGYFDLKKAVIYSSDGVYVKGVKNKVPRYFDKLLERENPDLFKVIKLARLNLVREKRLQQLTSNSVVLDEELYEIMDRVVIDKFKSKHYGGAL